MNNTHPSRLLRDAHIDWMANDGYTHAMTLNTDRELSKARLRDIFSNFCHRFDRQVHSLRNMNRMAAELRLRAIVFPENLSTNAHLHGFADFTSPLNVLGSEGRLREEVRKTWLQATRGAGSVELQSEPDKGWANYCTKRFDGTYFLAADFHPRL